MENDALLLRSNLANIDTNLTSIHSEHLKSFRSGSFHVLSFHVFKSQFFLDVKVGKRVTQNLGSGQI